jgi:hypothetical protein
MNKLTGQRQTVRAKRVAMPDTMVSRRREHGAIRAGHFRSYTNDLARATKTCQAALAAKPSFAE